MQEPSTQTLLERAAKMDANGDDSNETPWAIFRLTSSLLLAAVYLGQKLEQIEMSLREGNRGQR